MTLYSRPELRLLLVLAAAFLIGLAVHEWRAGFPELADRLERFDREEPTLVLPAVPLPGPTPPRRQPTPAAAKDAAPGPAATPPPETGNPRTRALVMASAGATPADPRPLDLNRASPEEIARLPGVGPGLARRIVEERERRGRFDSPDALRGVLGLGPKKLAALKDLVVAAGE